MIKIFIHSVLLFLIGILIYMNLIMALDVADMFFVTGAFNDYQNKYVGFSTLYDFLETGFVEDSSFLFNYQKFLDSYLGIIQRALYGNWVTMFQNGGTGSWIADIFVGIFNTLASILSIVGYLGYIIMVLVYVLSYAFWIVLKFIVLISGDWYSYMPPSPYWEV